MPLGANKAAIMGTAGVSTGPSAPYVVLLSSQTGADVSSISFTTQLTSAYPIYLFKVYNMNPIWGNGTWEWGVNAVGETGYNETITSTAVRSWHYEDDSVIAVTYQAAWHQSQDTAEQLWANGSSADADSSDSGELWLFNPSSTTYVKHFMSRITMNSHTHATTGPAANDQFYAGYINTTTAIDDIIFQQGYLNFDATIKLWGIK